jgi:hypothetical protein
MSTTYRFYVYAYLREDGTPYYIGKGAGKRAFKKHEKIPVPKDKSRIIFISENLIEYDAFALEMFFIAWYGRKDKGTGILRNRTDGGEGISGAICSEETKNKIGAANSGKTRTEEQNKKRSEARIGSKHSSETKDKIGKSKIGKARSEETKKKLRHSNPNSKKCTDGIKVYISIQEMAEAYNMTKQGIARRIKSPGYPEFNYL